MKSAERTLFIVASLLAVLGSSPSYAGPCAAAEAMRDGTDALEQRKDNLQRREWLLLEYLSSDGSKKSRKQLEAEVANSLERTQRMMVQLESLKALPDDTPEVPDEGTPACETITRVKVAGDEVLDARDKELATLTGEKYPFLKACDEIGVKLVNVAAGARKPGTTASTVSMLKLTLDMVMGPQIRQAGMNHQDFGQLVDEVFAADTLSPRAVAAYGALRCLRSHQRAGIKTLAAATPALAQCQVTPWAELGLCLDAATRTK
jgi:hypothetical protein